MREKVKLTVCTYMLQSFNPSFQTNAELDSKNDSKSCHRLLSSLTQFIVERDINAAQIIRVVLINLDKRWNDMSRCQWSRIAKYGFDELLQLNPNKCKAHE